MSTPRVAIQRIVVPFDGEPEHERAIAIAEAIAERTGADVELLSIVKSGATAGGATAGGATAGGATQVQRVAAHDGQSTRVITSNAVVESLMDAVHEPDALICLASSGHTAVTETLGSGVSAELLCRLDRPIVVVGPRCEATLRGEIMAILVDGSEDGERIVSDALDLADRLDLVPRFYRVLRDPESSSGHSSAYMDALVARHERDDGPLGYQVLSDPKPRRALAELVGRASIAMVAVASDGLETRQRLLQRSITHHIIRRAYCPVLVGSRQATV